jgi:hypothetical protein
MQRLYRIALLGAIYSILFLASATLIQSVNQFWERIWYTSLHLLLSDSITELMKYTISTETRSGQCKCDTTCGPAGS